jgi:hypothetical protein
LEVSLLLGSITTKHEQLKRRLINPYSLVHKDKFRSCLQKSIVSFANLPVGHTPDFICLAPWGGLNSVIEEFEEDVTISEEETSEEETGSETETDVKDK